MKKFKSILLILFATTFTLAENLSVLPEVGKPRGIVVYSNRLCIFEKSTVYMYDMEGFKLIKQFVKKGEGPGEAKSYISIRAFPDVLTIEDSGKIMFFSWDGIFKNEKRANTKISRISPFGNNFLGVMVNQNEDNQTQYLSINIFDKEFNAIKTLRRGEDHEVIILGKKREMKVIQDHFDYKLHNKRIYIGDSRKGFSITVFDSKGNQLYEINKKYKKIKVPTSFKDNYMKRVRKSVIWEKMKHTINFVFRDYYPAIYRFFVNNDKIYVFTYKKKEENGKNMRELVVLDLNGKILNQTFMPDEIKSAIYNDKYYYLVENMNEEVWEIHVQGID